MIGCLVLPYFYTEAETQRRPQGAGQQLVVHARGRIAALSPAAEAAGLRADMPLSQARAVAPDAEFLPYDEDLYQSASRRVLEVCAAYVTAIEPRCRHEVFLDLGEGVGAPRTGRERTHARLLPDLGASSDRKRDSSPSRGLGVRMTCPEALADHGAMAEIVAAVGRQTGFTGQAGAGSSKLIARIAALTQPGAVVPAGGEARFLAPLPLSQLWLLDADAIAHLQALGITTIGLLQRLSLTHLAQQFGREARRVRALARGVDDSPVQAVYPPQVIEARMAVAEGMIAAQAIDRGLRRLAAEVAEQLGARREKCNRLSLLVEIEGTRRLARAVKPRAPVAGESEILSCCRLLLRRMEIRAPVTMIGLEASDFSRCSSLQYDLFSGLAPGAQSKPAAGKSAQRRAHEALAVVQERFGARAVMRGAEIEAPRRERMLAALAGEAP